MFRKFNVYYNEDSGLFDHCSEMMEVSIYEKFCYTIETPEDELIEHRFSMGMYNTALFSYTVGVGKPMPHADILKAKRIFLDSNELYFTSESIIPPLPGIYFLYDAWGNLIYIGKANNLHRRLPDSLRDKKTAIYFQFAVTKGDADAVIYEQYYMSRYSRPSLNKEYPTEISADIQLPELTFTTKVEIKPVHLMRRNIFTKKQNT